MEGMAASISMATPKERRSQTGASSVRNIAMPNDAGTAISKAINEVNTVTTIVTKAPYRWLTGSHTLINKKKNPKVVIDTQLLYNNATMIANNNRNTKKANSRVTFLKMKSRKTF